VPQNSKIYYLAPVNYFTTLRKLLFILLWSAFSAAVYGSSALIYPNPQESPSNLNLDSLAKVFNNTGIKYVREGDFLLASEYFLKSLRIRESTPDFPKERLARGYFNYANIKLDLVFVDSAFIYYNKAEEILLKLESPNPDLLGMVLFEKGNCFTYKQDYSNAIVYIKRGISVLLQDSIIGDAESIVLAYEKLSRAYKQQGSIDEALDAALKAHYYALNYYNSRISNTLSSLGLLYKIKKDYKEALNYYLKSEERINDEVRFSRGHIISVYSNLGTTYWELGENDLAEFYFKKGFSLSPSTQVFLPMEGSLYINYGYFLRSRGEYLRAKEVFQKALVLNIKDGKSSDIEMLSFNDFYSLTHAAQCFEGLADVNLSLFYEKGEKKYIQESLNFYSKALEIIDNITSEIQTEIDKIAVGENYHIIYLKAIQTSLLLDTLRTEGLDYAVNISSKAKASALNLALAKERGLEFSGVPGQLINREQELRQVIGSLNEVYYEEKQKGKPSIIKLEYLESRLFEVQKEYREFISSLESDYPGYYALKYDNTSVTIQKIQKRLSPTQVLIDYVLTHNALISFAISKNSFEWKSQSIDRTFYDSLDVFLKQVNPSSIVSLNHQNFEDFVRSSYFLYRYLVKPYESILEGKELIVVPHLQLASIPFAALITDLPMKRNGYYALPYLARKVPISYFPSTKTFATSNKSRPLFRVKSISIAPDYKVIAANGIISSYRQNLGELPGAEQEVHSVSKILRGDMLIGNQASEAIFKKLAPKYDILHLAMHTQLDEKNPLYSKLVFAEPVDTLEDGFLNMYEVYGLKLNTKLSIISACRSGDGGLVKGEGLLSLARGFQYAGCPSMVAAQWRVDDYSGSDIMISFSQQLMKGLPKSKALQKAQLHYIDNSDPLRSHPYFWASYQIIGEDSSVYISPIIICFMVLIVTILFGAIVFVIVRKKVKLKRVQN
jgi:CHAT domain-containing protein